MFSLYFTALKKSSGQRNQPLFTDLGPNTRTTSDNDFVVLLLFLGK